MEAVFFIYISMAGEPSLDHSVLTSNASKRGRGHYVALDYQ